jgi:tripartite ATP-independent transporter DctP family solute receptor
MLLMPGNPTFNRRHAIGIGAAAAVAALGRSASPALAVQQVMLKASDVHPAGYPTVVAVENLARKLEKGTLCRLGVQMYPSMQLGGEKDAIEQAQQGAIQFARVSVGSLSAVVDDLGVFNLPFLFRDIVHMRKVIDGAVGQELLDKVTSHPQAGLVGLCWMDAGARSIYDTRKPINTIADLRGLKVRVMGNPMFVDMMNALGGNGVSMGYDEVLNALQTGAVDGAENNVPSFVFDKHFTVARYYTLTEHLILPEMLVFSKKAWGRLSGDDQALVRKYSREAQMEERELWVKYERAALEMAKSAGIQIVAVADKRPFVQAVQPIWDKYGTKYAETIRSIQAVQ